MKAIFVIILALFILSANATLGLIKGIIGAKVGLVKGIFSNKGGNYGGKSHKGGNYGGCGGKSSCGKCSKC
jgi:hypothetical protein